MFENGLEEFDDARHVLSWHIRSMKILLITFGRATCEELLKEYKACESPDYITYVCNAAFLFSTGDLQIHRVVLRVTKTHSTSVDSIYHHLTTL